MIIPQNGIYKSGEHVYTSGQPFPEEAKIGDSFSFGDYEYKYGFKASLVKHNPWLKNEKQNGWGIRVIDKNKEKYDSILPFICNKPITSIRNAFYECTEMLIAPEIPDTVCDMFGAFSGCIKLKDVPHIPQNIQNIDWAFEYCESIREISHIKTVIDNANGVFADCSGITSVPLNFPIQGKNIFLNCPIKSEERIC